MQLNLGTYLTITIATIILPVRYLHIQTPKSTLYTKTNQETEQSFKIRGVHTLFLSLLHSPIFILYKLMPMSANNTDDRDIIRQLNLGVCILFISLLHSPILIPKENEP